MIPEDSVAEVRSIGVMLPSYPELTLDEQKYIVNCFKEHIICKTNG